MRLYLSSTDIGDRAGSLLALLGSANRVALISDQDAAADRLRAQIAALGLAVTDLDLARGGGHEGLRRRLQGADLVWVDGADPFALRAQMQQSGFDDLIVELLDSDALAYAGSAAGTILAGPSLRGFEPMADAGLDLSNGTVPAKVSFDGLGLIDHSIVPHFRSAKRTGARAEAVTRRLCALGLRYRTLRDGEAIVWTESRRADVEPLRRIA